MPTGIAATQNATRNAVCLKVTGIADCAAYRIALKLRRAEERLIPQSTRAASFKRLLGSRIINDRYAENAGWYREQRQPQRGGENFHSYRQRYDPTCG